MKWTLITTICLLGLAHSLPQSIDSETNASGSHLVSGVLVSDSGMKLLWKHHDAKVTATLSLPENLQKTRVVDISKTGFPLIYSARNQASNSVNVLNRMTPFEGMLDNLLAVRNADGKIVTYRGATAQRWPIENLSLDDYVELAPNEKKKTTLDIRDSYAFDKDGVYTFEIRQPIPKTVLYAASPLRKVSIRVIGVAARRKVLRKQQQAHLALLDQSS